MAHAARADAAEWQIVLPCFPAWAIVSSTTKYSAKSVSNSERLP
jgi:hypothetical protein